MSREQVTPLEERYSHPGGNTDRYAEGYAAGAAVASDLLAACKVALSHVSELREAWRSGAIRETDGKGGLRSNTNVDVETRLRAAIATATKGAD